MFRKKTGMILVAIGTALVKIGQILYEPPNRKRVRQWLKVKGEKTLRLQYDLSETSTVMDLGGFEGQWTSDIFSKYLCVVHVFEPVREYANQIKERFASNNKILIHNFGLAEKTKLVEIGVDSNRSSIYKKGNKIELVQLKKASEFIIENNIQYIDLLKVNIEGGEYDLLEHLIEGGHIKMIKNIQVQFHEFVPNAEQRRQSIQKKLDTTHKLTFEYPFVWENWRLKSDNIS